MLVVSAASLATMMSDKRHETRASRVRVVSAASSASMMNHKSHKTKASRVLVVSGCVLSSNDGL